MVAPAFAPTKSPCECGDIITWRRSGILAPRWRMECLCGRCGPWRSEPETRQLGVPPMLHLRTPSIPLPGR